MVKETWNIRRFLSYRYSNKPPPPLQVTKGLKAGGGGGGFFSVSGKKEREREPPTLDFSLQSVDNGNVLHQTRRDPSGLTRRFFYGS